MTTIDDIVARLRVWAHDAALQDAREHSRGLSDAARMIERLREERDEARRMFCDSQWNSRDPREVAEMMGWDCYQRIVPSQP